MNISLEPPMSISRFPPISNSSLNQHLHSQSTHFSSSRRASPHLSKKSFPSLPLSLSPFSNKHSAKSSHIDFALLYPQTPPSPKTASRRSVLWVSQTPAKSAPCPRAAASQSAVLPATPPWQRSLPFQTELPNDPSSDPESETPRSHTPARRAFGSPAADPDLRLISPIQSDWTADSPKTSSVWSWSSTPPAIYESLSLPSPTNTRRPSPPLDPSPAPSNRA